MTDVERRSQTPTHGFNPMTGKAGTKDHDAGQPELGTVGLFGAAAIDLLIGGRELYSVFVRALYYMFNGRREKGALVQQMYEMGNKSMFFLSSTMGFIGMIMVY